MQPLIALSLVCVIVFIRLASISFWRDTEFAICLGYVNKVNDTYTMDKEALEWIDFSLKGKVIDMLSNPTESIAQSGVELFGYWDCLKVTANLTNLGF